MRKKDRVALKRSQKNKFKALVIERDELEKRRSELEGERNDLEAQFKDKEAQYIKNMKERDQNAWCLEVVNRMLGRSCTSSQNSNDPMDGLFPMRVRYGFTDQEWEKTFEDKSKSGKVQGKIDRLKLQINSLTTDINFLSTRLPDLERRIKRLNDQIKLQKGIIQLFNKLREKDSPDKQADSSFESNHDSVQQLSTEKGKAYILSYRPKGGQKLGDGGSFSNSKSLPSKNDKSRKHALK